MLTHCPGVMMTTELMQGWATALPLKELKTQSTGCYHSTQCRAGHGSTMFQGMLADRDQTARSVSGGRGSRVV
jgi:hypothetical protein